MNDDGIIRTFISGATRDTDMGKNDYEGFNNPLVELDYGDYMTEHRVQSDGSLRDSDNWQKGMGKKNMIKSLIRHVFDLWAIHRGYFVYKSRDENGEKTHYRKYRVDYLPSNWKVVTKRDCLGGIRFNVDGYWLEDILEEQDKEFNNLTTTINVNRLAATRDNESGKIR